MAEVTLRPTRPQDLAFVTALERHPDNRDFIGQWSDAEHLAAIARDNGREHWVIESGGERAGYFIAYDCRAHDAGFYVKRLLVGQRERGLGTAALRQFLARVRSMEGVSCVWLIVRQANTRAQKVYTNLGFRRFVPSPEELLRYDAAAEAARDPDFRMRLAP